jgi:hypothetical protein
VFPVRYELDSCILFRRNSVFKRLSKHFIVEFVDRERGKII